MWALQPDALLQPGVPDCSLAQPQALLPACKSVQQHRGMGGGQRKSLGLHIRALGHHKTFPSPPLVTHHMPCISLPHASVPRCHQRGSQLPPPGQGLHACAALPGAPGPGALSAAPPAGWLLRAVLA